MNYTKEHKMQLVRAYWNETDDEQLNKELDSLLVSCKTKSEKLSIIAELCKPAETNEELYFISKAYVWAGADYRSEAIEYLKKYIAAGAICDETPEGIREMNGISYDLKSMSVASVYTDLGNCFANEYEFDKAIECYQEAYSLVPYISSNAVKISEMYVKKNELVRALDYLETIKSSIYYKLEIYSSVIDKCITDVQKKIEKGYVYKPRKKKI